MSSTKDWKFHPKTGMLFGYTGSDTDVVIPAEIDGVPVIQIGMNAFHSSLFTSVTIPNSVTYIGYGAFHNNRLTSVIIPNSVTHIGHSAFQGNMLTSVVIPNSVIDIGGWAFYFNPLTSVIVPDSVIRIGENAFWSGQFPKIPMPVALPERFYIHTREIFCIVPAKFHRSNIDKLTEYYGQYQTDLIRENMSALGDQFGASVMSMLVAQDKPPPYEEMVKVCCSIPKN